MCLNDLVLFIVCMIFCFVVFNTSGNFMYVASSKRNYLLLSVLNISVYKCLKVLLLCVLINLVKYIFVDVVGVFFLSSYIFIKLNVRFIFATANGYLNLFCLLFFLCCSLLNVFGLFFFN